MGLLDKAKAAAEQAAVKAKEGVEDVQTKRELSQAYGDLGRLAFSLVESGELSNNQLDALVDKIRALEAKASDEPVPAGAAASTSTDPPSSNQPPAMPT
jgi:hypothetical protein